MSFYFFLRFTFTRYDRDLNIRLCRSSKVHIKLLKTTKFSGDLMNGRLIFLSCVMVELSVNCKKVYITEGDIFVEKLSVRRELRLRLTAKLLMNLEGG